VDRLARRVAALERKAADPPDARSVWREATKRLTDEDLAVLAAFGERWIAAGGLNVEFTPDEREAFGRFEGLMRDVRRDRRLSPLMPGDAGTPEHLATEEAPKDDPP
jgi:hypothetical protein